MTGSGKHPKPGLVEPVSITVRSRPASDDELLVCRARRLARRTPCDCAHLHTSAPSRTRRPWFGTLQITQADDHRPVPRRVEQISGTNEHHRRQSRVFLNPRLAAVATMPSGPGVDDSATGSEVRRGTCEARVLPAVTSASVEAVGSTGEVLTTHAPDSCEATMPGRATQQRVRCSAERLVGEVGIS